MSSWITAIHNIKRLNQGATFSLDFTLSGLGFSLTGWTGAAQMRSEYADVSAAGTFTVEVVPTTDGGTVTISMDPTATEALTVGTYVYDLELIETATGRVERPIEGRVTVKPGATK